MRNLVSLFCLAIVIVLLFLLANGFLSGLIGKVGLIAMVVVPLLGIFFALKGSKGFLKWVLLTLNVITFISIIYLLLLAFGMGER